MKYEPNIHHRRSIRLKRYDYSQASAYFVTICTNQRQHRFGKIVGGIMQLNEMGQMVADEWHDLPNRFDAITLNEFIVMPNHIHGIITVDTQSVGAPFAGALSQSTDENIMATAMVAPTTTIGDIVGAYRSLCVHKILKWIGHNSPSTHLGILWQRNYWEHIVRNENEYQRIAQYIRNNPEKWEQDRLNGGDGNTVMEPHAEYEA